MRSSRSTSRAIGATLGILLGAVTLTVCTADSPRITENDVASKDMLVDDFGSVSVCKFSGPVGTYNYSVAVSGGGDFTLPAGPIVPLVWDGITPVCTRVYETSLVGTWAE